MATPSSGPRPSDRWIPWYIIGFFVLMVLTLVPMCIIAVRTNTGVITEHAYEKGLAYNKTINDAEQQHELGWRGDLAVTPLADNMVKASFILKDANGKMLTNANVTLWFIRPTQDGMDQHVAMQIQPGGPYGAEIKLPANGLWEAHVSAMLDGHNFQSAKRVELP